MAYNEIIKTHKGLSINLLQKMQVIDKFAENTNQQKILTENTSQ